ncbi:hypothetical protein Baya_7301 [Bagarius yarrelli]|uniref:Uncharacterized protein n=1 Tax=Bagarius yarrelli TaxID=175774 RepID=A0A556TZU1_BAGYA|nr:hypothetical protein Baya_7301 [Bagarius yarrelli]
MKYEPQPTEEPEPERLRERREANGSEKQSAAKHVRDSSPRRRLAGRQRIGLAPARPTFPPNLGSRRFPSAKEVRSHIM